MTARALLAEPSAAPAATAAQGLRLAILLASLEGRGIQRAWLNLSAWLAGRGARVTLLLCRPDGELSAVLPAEVERRALEPGPAPRAHLLAARALGRGYTPAIHRHRRLHRLPALAAWLRDHPVDVLLSGGTEINLLAALACSLLARPPALVLSEQNDLHAKTRRPSRRWKLRAIRAAYARADALVATADGVARSFALAGIAPETVQVIPNPVVTAALEAQARRPPPHPWLADRNVPVILGVGALEDRKNFALLLRAAARVHARRPVRVVLLGEGPQRAMLEALAAELGLSGRVLMPGFVAEVGAWMAHAGVLALTSLWEGFANVVAEALACGCPVVSVDCPHGPAEILAHGRYGRLVRNDDEAALAGALEQTLAAPPPRSEIIARGREYSADAIGARYLELFATLRAGAPGRGSRRET